MIGLYLRRVNPEVIAARVNRHEGTKGWDRCCWACSSRRWSRSCRWRPSTTGGSTGPTCPWWACGIGYALLIAGMAGLTWAESVNKFFEPTVRIQADRGHTVIDTGPYAIIRHPGYVAACLLILGMPLSLGSFWALIPAVLSCLLLVVRTVLEDRTLRAELPGYKEYAQRVRYRLVPGVW